MCVLHKYMSNGDYHTRTSHHTTACMHETSVLILLVVYYMATHTERDVSNTYIVHTVLDESPAGPLPLGLL